MFPQTNTPVGSRKRFRSEEDLYQQVNKIEPEKWIVEKPSEITNGMNIIFTASQPFIVETLKVYVDGIRCIPDDDYVLDSDTQIRFINVPVNGAKIMFDYIANR